MLLSNLTTNFTILCSSGENSQEVYYPEIPNQNKDSTTAFQKVENLFSGTFSSFPVFHFPNAIYFLATVNGIRKSLIVQGSQHQTLSEKGVF